MQFEEFIKEFVPQVERKSTQLNKAYWLLETTGHEDAADLKADLDTEFKMLFNDPEVYKQLLAWDEEDHDPIQKRQLNVLIRAFKQNQISKDLLDKTSQKEAQLARSYAQFRPEVGGKKLTENEIREILKSENNPEKRKKAWESSKDIGKLLAPQILELVELRNVGAQALGYPDYFQMQLDLQEVDGKWLLKTLDELSLKSEKAYTEVLKEIETEQEKRFNTKDLGPWAWSDPFCQEDPLDNHFLDQLVQGIDIVQTSRDFYKKMGIDVSEILAKSDMYEREGKNQHAFCMNVDRKRDVRTLNNVESSIKWLETVLHELGHGIYELGFDDSLPWLLREPPHMISTEAMALLAGRQAYRSESLAELISPECKELREKADHSLKRRQLIFSRWVLVMTAFESELYRDPKQDLNKLWWDYVEKYQKIKRPSNREDKFDWAAKYHIGLAPVYYFSYLLGEMFASSIQEMLQKETGSINLTSPKAGKFLQDKLFNPGNLMSWSELAIYVTGEELSSVAWVKEFAT